MQLCVGPVVLAVEFVVVHRARCCNVVVFVVIGVVVAVAVALVFAMVVAIAVIMVAVVLVPPGVAAVVCYSCHFSRYHPSTNPNHQQHVYKSVCKVI
jgi:hypothetical protein